MKVLLNSFHLNGHTLGFHIQRNKQHHMKVLLNSFHLNGPAGNERVKYFFSRNHDRFHVILHGSLLIVSRS